eukprot:359040-Chlamydomonas_euryale.AAC.3
MVHLQAFLPPPPTHTTAPPHAPRVPAATVPSFGNVLQNHSSLASASDNAESKIMRWAMRPANVRVASRSALPQRLMSPGRKMGSPASGAPDVRKEGGEGRLNRRGGEGEEVRSAAEADVPGQEDGVAGVRGT